MKNSICSRPASNPTSRRQFLYGLGASLGSVAFSDLVAREAAKTAAAGPLAPKAPMLPAKAKGCIMLFMEGGPSHIDTFDPKPMLNELHLKEFVRNSEKTSGMTNGNRFYVGSPYEFKPAGNAGIPMCEHFVHMSDPAVADELCVYRGCQAESVNHPTALYHMNTGNKFGGDPAIGSWVTYGLGAENQNLPGYVVMTELAAPQGGSGNWSNGFLPAYYQGTQLRSEGSAILDLQPPEWKNRDHQRANLDILNELNATHLDAHPQHADLAARMENYELAYRMQMSVPGVIDIDKEPEHIKEMYGLNDKETAPFGRQCLLARRLIEQGVRFVQIFSGGWDSHDYIERAHKKRIYSVDRPIAALIKDLKSRGMLDETLVTWTGEFGRTPDNTVRGGETAIGRDHNAEAMAMFFAGGGTKAGTVVGATDDIGEKAVEVVHPIRDVHVSMLHLLGLDDNKLTYFHGGRFKQLSQFGGQVIPELIA
uniref:Secreted protein n=1 Tax=uncultured bacterium 12-5D TaxID=1497524 RepID=A0A059U2G0_9BACT|nr:secreted protein [uncultured bacterium 12-5D]